MRAEHAQDMPHELAGGMEQQHVAGSERSPAATAPPAQRGTVPAASARLTGLGLHCATAAGGRDLR